MAAELNRLMKVRRAALDRFDETAIKKDQPMATMEEVLVPIYMSRMPRAGRTSTPRPLLSVAGNIDWSWPVSTFISACAS